MEVNYVHKDTLTATEYVELNKNNELPISYNQVLLKENQELKSIINQIGFEPDEIAFLQQENAELNKQLKELRNRYKNKLEKLLSEYIEPDPEDFYLAEIEGKANDYDKLLIQQQEFIKYLEDYIKDRNETRQMHEMYSESENRLSSQYFILQEILQKYKELTGVSDEKEN